LIAYVGLLCGRLGLVSTETKILNLDRSLIFATAPSFVELIDLASDTTLDDWESTLEAVSDAQDVIPVSYLYEGGQL